MKSAVIITLLIPEYPSTVRGCNGRPIEEEVNANGHCWIIVCVQGTNRTLEVTP